jgi:hypothetical protein
MTIFPATMALIRSTYITRVVNIIAASKEEHGAAFDICLEEHDREVVKTERARMVDAITRGSARDIVARNGGDTSQIDAIISLIESQA